jgi:hypothetical protein
VPHLEVFLTHTRYRIPRATQAALLLGGAACGGLGGAACGGGGTPGGSTEGINTSSARISALAKTACQQYQECDREYFDESYDSLAQCIDVLEDEFDVPAISEKCADAFLDYISCTSQLSCDELGGYEYDDEKCGDLHQSYVEACGFDDDEYESATGTSSVKRVAPARARVSKYRIPR